MLLFNKIPIWLKDSNRAISFKRSYKLRPVYKALLKAKTNNFQDDLLRRNQTASFGQFACMRVAEAAVCETGTVQRWNYVD